LLNDKRQFFIRDVKTLDWLNWNSVGGIDSNYYHSAKGVGERRNHFRGVEAHISIEGPFVFHAEAFIEPVAKLLNVDCCSRRSDEKHENSKARPETSSYRFSRAGE